MCFFNRVIRVISRVVVIRHAAPSMNSPPPPNMRKVVNRLLMNYSKDHPWIASAAILSLAVVPVQDILLPHLTGKMVNAVKDAAAGKRGSALIVPFVVVVVAIAVLQAGYVGVDMVDAVTFPSVISYFRAHMLRCALNSNDGVGHGGDVHTGDLLSKFVKLPATMAFWFESVKSLAPYVLVYLAATAYFAWIDPVLGAAMGVTVLILAIAMATNLDKCTEVSTQRDSVVNGLHESIDDTLRNLSAVNAGMQQKQEIARVAVEDVEFRRLYFETVKCSMNVKMFMVPATVVLVGVVLWRCQGLVRSGRMSAGTFVSVFLVIMYIMSSMIRIAGHARSMVYHWGVVNASASSLVDCAPPSSSPSSSSPSSSSPSTTLSSSTASTSSLRQQVMARGDGGGFGLWEVTYRIPDGGPRILDRFSLHVSRGERVALLGPVGSGKSTVLRLLLEMLHPTSGTLYLRGATYDRLTPGEVRAAFGYVPQTTVLFDRTVLENILFGNEGHGAADVWVAAERIGALQTLRTIGLGTAVGKAGSKLSGGQRQLVWLLRVLVGRPYALLMDEPTSALDDESKTLVSAAIDVVGTALVVTHDTDFARSFATRIVHVDDHR